MGEKRIMSIFFPSDFGYELQAGDHEMALHYQKKINSETPDFIDIIEMAFYKKPKTWVLFIRSENIKQFFTEIEFENGQIYSLFIGTILSDFDFRFIMTKICKDPNTIIQVGC